jgi:dipeptidase E
VIGAAGEVSADVGRPAQRDSAARAARHAGKAVRCGLADGFLNALEDRVYVGVSAGSMIFSRNLDAHSADVMGDAADLHVLGATALEPPFGLFDWYLKPHLYSPGFPERGDAWADRIAARADFPVYFIDDDTAIRVNGGEVDVVSEGRWRFQP